MNFITPPYLSTGICLIILLFTSCQPSSNTGDTAEGLQEAEKKVQKLVYISNKANGFDVFKNDISGQQEQNLTNLEGWEWYPQFVKDKGLIIFNRQDTAGNFTLKAMNLDGEEQEFETNQLPGFEISPNGEWVAYTRKQNESTQIIVAPLFSPEDSIQITANDFYNGRPNWSWDSSKLAYISDRTGSNEIYLYDLDQKTTKRLTDNEVREKYLSWSPDGLFLATSMAKDTLPNDLFLIALSTGEVTQLTNTPINESEISWSPKGDFMAYHAQVDGKDDIYILNLNSKNIKKITDGQAYYGEPRWILE